MTIAVLYADDALVVVMKPSGLVVHPGGMTNERDTAMTRVRDALGARVWPVHRLDRGTSGALVFARSAEVARILGEAFERGAVEKRYLALARGAVPERVRVDYAVPKDEGGDRVPAVTDLVRLANVTRYSLVLALPRTGRFHQVRRHLKHLRHPIYGDTNYGDGKANRHARETLGLSRLALHAWSISLAHPRTFAPLSVVAPLPDDLDAPLAKLGIPEPLRRADPTRFEVGVAATAGPD